MSTHTTKAEQELAIREAAATATATAKKSWPASHRALMISSAALVVAVVVTSTIGGVAVANEATRTAIAASAAESAEALTTAEKLNAAVQSSTEASINEALDAYLELPATLEAGKSVIPEKNLAPLTKSLEALHEELKKLAGDAVAEDGSLHAEADIQLTDYAKDTIERAIDKDASTDELKTLIDKYDAATKKVVVDSTKKIKAAAAVKVHVDKVLKQLEKIAAECEEWNKKVLEASPSAAQEAKDTLAKATEDLKKDGAASEYIVALAAVKASHVAAETQKAIDAAAKPVVPAKKPTTTSDKGETGSGEVTSQPLKLVTAADAECIGFEGYQKAPYGETLTVPMINLKEYATYELHGYGWKVRWYCNP